MKKRLKEWLPNRDKILRQRALRAVAHLLEDENLWHLNRRSVPIGGAIGIFLGFMPILGQMPLAATLALLFRGNIAIALAFTWISNPVTALPIFSACYGLGRLLIGYQGPEENFQFTFEWLLANLMPLGAGCLVAGLSAALITFVLLNQLWKEDIRRRWQRRGITRKKANTTSDQSDSE